MRLSRYSRRARLLPVLIMLLSSVLTACDSSPTPTPIPQSPVATPTLQATLPIETPSPAVDATREIGASPTTAAGNTPIVLPTRGPSGLAAPPSSLSKLAQAERDGTLDHDTALLYTLYAYFDRDSLPNEYQGDDSAINAEGMNILGDVALRFDSVSPELQSKFEPFFLRPDDPSSFWNKVADAPQGKVPGVAAPLLQGATWLNVDARNTNIRVWYPKPESGDGLAPLAAQLAQEIDTSEMWKKEKLVMKDKEPCSDTRHAQSGGSGHFDVYLTAPNLPVPRNASNGAPATLRAGFGGDFIIPMQNLGSSCPIIGFALLNSALPFKELKSYMAHELFHGYQAAMTPKILDPQWTWWVESSASWAMDLIYPTANVEHGFLVDGQWARQESLIGPLTCDSKPINCHYGAYLWPYFFTRGGGGAIDEYIGTLWDQSKQKPPIEVMSQISGWPDLWKKFALWNWNEGPADFYRDPDDNGGVGHITELLQKATDIGMGVPPNGSSNRIGPGDPLWPGVLLPLGDKKEAQVSLPPTSFDYYATGKPDDAAGVLHFEFPSLTGQEGASVQALVTIGDPAAPRLRYYEDWSNRTERKFCLDRPDEYATSVVVIVANSKIVSAPLQGTLTATAKSETCPNRSSLNFTVGGSYALHSPTSQQPGSVDGSMSTFEQVQSTWSLEFDSRNGDSTYYNFTSTNVIDLHASANLSASDPSTRATSNANLNASGTTHNPTQPGDSGYGQKTRGTLGQQWQNFPHPDLPGTLYLTKINGKDAYVISLGFTPLVPQYNQRTIVTSKCTDKTSVTHDYTYDNSSFTERTMESGDRKCFQSDGKPHKTSGPFQFGSITLDFTTPRGPAGSTNFIAGYYDPKVGVLEGYETYSTQVCRDAYKLDPFVWFLGQAENLMYVTHEGMDDPKNATCRFYYTVSWRVELPKQP